MAGGLHIFGTPQTSMMILNVERDTEYDLMRIAERFEVPYMDTTRMSINARKAYGAMIEVKSREVGKHAIYQYERLKKWKFYDKRPVELDISDANYDLDEFSTSRNVPLNGVMQGSLIDTKGMVAYVLKMWFIVPKIRVEVITPEVDDEDVTDGLVNPFNIDGYLTSKNESKVVNND